MSAGAIMFIVGFVAFIAFCLWVSEDVNRRDGLFDAIKIIGIIIFVLAWAYAQVL